MAPAELKCAVADIVGTYPLMPLTCVSVAIITATILRRAGIDAVPVLGGLIVRVGPSPHDLMAYCDTDGCGIAEDGVLYGHSFVRAGDTLIDFSLSGLLADHRLLAEQDPQEHASRNFTESFDFYWGPAAPVMVARPRPIKPGEFIYTPFRGSVGVDHFLTPARRMLIREVLANAEPQLRALEGTYNRARLLSA